jgi:hypothetical protein
VTSGSVPSCRRRGENQGFAAADRKVFGLIDGDSGRGCQRFRRVLRGRIDRQQTQKQREDKPQRQKLFLSGHLADFLRSDKKSNKICKDGAQNAPVLRRVYLPRVTSHPAR